MPRKPKNVVDELPIMNEPVKTEPPTPPRLPERVRAYEDKQFTITFHEIPKQIICPRCKKVQFEVWEGPLYGDIKHKCDRCKVMTRYRFRVMITRSLSIMLS